MRKKRDVRMGDYKIGTDEQVLSALGIGSCVAVCIYTEEKSKAALAHVMLPTEEGKNTEKHAHVLLPQMLEHLKLEDIEKEEMKAKIFGGATMFPDNTIDIGKQNVKSVKEILGDEDIEIQEEDTGGAKGRAVWLNCRSGDVVVRKNGEKTQRF